MRTDLTLLSACAAVISAGSPSPLHLAFDPDDGCHNSSFAQEIVREHAPAHGGKEAFQKPNMSDNQNPGR